MRRRPPRPVPALGAGTWAAAGNRFTKLRVVPPLPIGAYREKISGVPLTGGQAQGLIPASFSSSSSQNAPPAFTIITEFTVTATAVYTIAWSVALSGTPGAGDANNFALFRNHGPYLATSVNAGASGSYPQASFTAFLNAGDTVTLASNTNAATAGSVYSGTLSASVPLTLTAGPQGLGTVWYPAQITLSTTTGPLDTGTAQVYLGSGGVPTMLVASVFTGNGTAALAIPPLQPGELIIVTWTGGHGGDTASFNIIGTMDALTTGRRQ